MHTNICHDGCIVQPKQILLTIDLYNLQDLKNAEKLYPGTLTWLIDYFEEKNLLEYYEESKI